ADNAYMDTGDKEWLEKSKEEKKLIEKAEKELKAINNLSKYSKDARDFIKEIYELRDIWVELQGTPEGRTNIIRSFIERIEVTDDKDDPDKYKLKLYIKADPESNASTELDVAVNLKVQDCLAKVHQTGIGRTRFISETALPSVCCADASQKSSRGFTPAVFLIIKYCRRYKSNLLCRRLLTVIFLKFLHFLPNSILSIEAELTVRKNRQSF
ncbi:MAG: hypothetical protein K6F64_09020, partial [Clostridia bacterium]|nr:hypothetical protein [Clostridia bacterium]